ncbi:uncharacterized protein HMPREF1541_10812 [Cyphellophora europaea CBS 101466]|uniref:Uncharacterized protein n=1 Tax=Cyphellophora europaea (strain CBS 101466) TaxID=1220924 RepID=W2S6D2_CYPE1|nr:uncharacterized protein HMPREF1541_10812 [Cyphellophora europaea CBS 101466]ETN44261.1 hypothetical protein HMPREF1541_10812 [Cyphellophora europaea CBS 101466]
MSSPMRRSRRERRTNPRYVGADWDRDTLRRIRAASTSSGSSPSDRDIIYDQSEDEDFRQTTTFAEEPSSGSDDVSLTSEGSSPVSDNVGRNDSWSRISNGGMKPKVTAQGLPVASASGLSRGLKDPPKNGSPAILYPTLYGSGEEDLSPILHAREVWLRARDVTLPSQSTLRSPESSFTFLQQQAEGQVEASLSHPKGGPRETHPWRKSEKQRPTIGVSDFDLKSILLKQKLKVIDESIALAQQYLPTGLTHSLVRGHNETLHLSNVGIRSCCSLGGDVTPQHTSSASTPSQNQVEGWMINVGEKVKALAWAPVLGPKQYLAVATGCTPAQRAAHSTPRRLFGPAFTPSSNYPSAVQLWSFGSTIVPTQATLQEYFSLDAREEPRLEQVIGIRGGDIRCLEWAPTSPLNTDQEAPRMLAILTTDSHVRILALDFHYEGPGTSFLELETSPIDISPPAQSTSPIIMTRDDSVFSTISWASSKDLLVGCSNGMLYAYDVLECAKSPNPPQPFFDHMLHNTYIMALAPAYPLLPATGNFVASSSAGGDTTLTDLRHPVSDTVTFPRARLPSKPLTYSPFTRSFFTAYEPSARGSAEGSFSTTVVCHHLRRFYKIFHIARLPSQSGAATSLASSIHHPSLLIGNACGDVFATNYLRRVLVNRPASRTRSAWLQQLCRYDWRPADEANPNVTGTNDPNNTDVFHGPPTRPGISRLTFGFRPEHIDLSLGRGAESKARGSKRSRKRKDQVEQADLDIGGDVPEGRGKEKVAAKGKDDKHEDPAAAEVIFEEEQAVTAMDWNVNRAAAGWAAIGWGSGLVMIKDLSIEL